jgi:hypothetical protein
VPPTLSLHVFVLRHLGPILWTRFGRNLQTEVADCYIQVCDNIICIVAISATKFRNFIHYGQIYFYIFY